MYPAGIEIWEKRDKKNMMKASYEQKGVKLGKPFEAKLKSNPKAWQYFDKELTPSYKKLSIHWIMSAKKEETQWRRLDKLIESSEKGECLPQFRWEKKA